jgi:WD40 repeat protein
VKLSKGAVFGLEFSQDGERVVTSSGSPPDWSSQVMKIWNARTGEEIFNLQANAAIVGSVAYSPDGNLVARAVRNGGIVIWDARSGQLLETIPDAPANQIAFHPDSKRVACAAGDSVILREARGGKILLTIKAHQTSVRQMMFTADGKRLFTTGGEGNMRIWDTETGQELLTLKNAAQGRSFLFNGRLFANHEDGVVRIYDGTPLPEPAGK